MKSLKKRSGFTLIEVLIVVVIIGILAALILPRMLSQPEKAVAAEANQFLGVLRRAQTNLVDSTGAGSFLTVADVAAGGTNAEWQQLGMKPLDSGTKFTYACTGGTLANCATAANVCTCTATRIGTSSFTGATITVDLNTGLFTCDGALYTAITSAGGPVRICGPAT